MDQCTLDKNIKCDGKCKFGKDNYCYFMYVDEVWHIMQEWKKEAGVKEPIIWKKDRKRNKVCLYTTKPGYFIGPYGALYEKYYEKLKDKNECFKNGLDFVDCDDYIEGE